MVKFSIRRAVGIAALVAAFFPGANLTASGASLSVSTTQLSFYSSGGQIPPAQTVSLTSTAGVLPLSVASNALWLSYSLSSAATPAILTVQVSPQGLAEGNYSATLAVTGSGADNSPVTINVSLTVVGAPSSAVNPSQLAFSYITGGALPNPQIVTLSGSGTSFTVTSSDSWLGVTANSSFTPAQLTVTVTPYALLAGTYTGTITITLNTSPATYYLVSVTLTVDGGTGTSWTTSGPLSFAHRFGDPAPAPQTLSVTHVIPTYFVVEVGSASWIKVDPTTAITPATLTVTVDPTGLLAGTYTGNITITSLSGLGSITVPVTLVVTGAPQVFASPSALDFQGTAGGSPPATKTVSITSSPATSFTAQAPGFPWISISPSSGLTPQTLTVTVNPANLTPGTYRGSILIVPTGAGTATQLIVVTFVVQASNITVSAAPTSFRFDAATGGSPPVPQSLTVTATAPTSVAVAASPGWLAITPANGTTPVTFSISVTPAGLDPGIYSGTITVSAPGATPGTQTIPVTLNVAGVAPSIRELSNGSGLFREFAPGSTIIVYGRDIGPRDPLGARLSSGQVDSTLGGVRLLFNGIAAPLLYVSSGQVNAIVPFELAGQRRVEVQIFNQNVPSDKVTITLDESAPVLFTLDGTGRGQGAVVNQNGSVNSSAAPAPRGSVVLLYAAGGGLFETPVQTGVVASGAGPRLRAPVSVYIGGIPAEVHYASWAPGMVAGILQLNVRIPMEVPPGNATVSVKIGNAFSQPGVTLVVE